MNPVQVHLALNHFPLFAVFFGIAILSFGILRKAVPMRRLGLWFFVAAALGTVPVFFSGKSTEHIVKERVAASEVAETHEKAATFALAGAAILGLLSVFLLFVERNRKLPNAAWGGVMVVAVWVLSIFLRTAYLGGEIRHDELRNPAPQSTAG
jgi:uncharacterized membrane protein